MRIGLWISILLVSSWGLAQNCVTYLLVTPVNPDTSEVIDGLRADDFEASLDNNSLPVVKATKSLHNRILVLAAATNKGVDQEAAAILNGVLESSKEQPIALGVFAERAVFTREFFTNPQERKAGADQLILQLSSIGERPALYEALHQALQVFGTHQTGDTVILVGTGADSGSHRKLGDIEDEFVRSGTRLLVAYDYDIALRKSPFSPLATMAALSGNDPDLANFAAMTGGIYLGGSLFGPRKHPVNIMQLASAGYLLEINLPSKMDKPRKWKLKLRGAEAKAHKKAVILSPSKLHPCNTTTATP